MGIERQGEENMLKASNLKHGDTIKYLSSTNDKFIKNKVYLVWVVDHSGIPVVLSEEQHYVSVIDLNPQNWESSKEQVMEKINLNEVVTELGVNKDDTEEYTRALSDTLRGYIHSAREEQGLSQRALATKAGITQKAISTYENGLTVISLPSLFKIMTVLDIEVTISIPEVVENEQ